MPPPDDPAVSMRVLTRIWLCSLLAGCATQRPVETGILFRSQNFPLVVDSGLAVAPVGHADAVADAGEIAARLSNQMTTAMMLEWQGSFIPPDHLLATLRVGGEAMTETFRQFRIDRMHRREMERPACAEMSRIVQHRYLLLTWVHEEVLTAMDATAADYTSAEYAKDVSRLQYDRIRGHLTGVLVDLWEAELVWEGRTAYETSKIYADAEPAAQELAKARDQGVDEFVRLLTAP